MSTHHTVACQPEHCHWGFFDSALPPVVTVASGDTVTLDCVSGGRDDLPSDPALRNPRRPSRDPRGADAAARRAHPDRAGRGRGRRAGRCLADRHPVDRAAAELGLYAHPAAGRHPARGFPDHARCGTATIDRQRGVATLPIGIEIELAPFFGVMGVAPPPVYGACSSIQPREFGGNMDLKELVAGTTLYLPVWAPGALFSVGDGHGVQGDGEVCITALETALSRHVPADRAQGPRASSCRAPRRRRTTSRWRSTKISTTRRRTRCAR